MTANKRSGRIRRVIIGYVILLFVTVLSMVAIRYYVNHRLQVHLYPSDRAVEVRVMGGTPWKNNLVKYQIIIRDPSTVNVETEEPAEIYSDYIDKFGNLKLNYVLFSRGRPGDYSIIVRDSLQHEVSANLNIPPNYSPPIKIDAIHTTSEINKENGWSTGVQTQFDTGDLIYLFANITVYQEMTVHVKWGNTLGLYQFHDQKLPPSTQPFYLYDSHYAAKPGTFAVYLVSGDNFEVLGKAWYRVIGQ